MLSILVFIIILGLLIFVHELGHFVTARRNGIRASEFGFGFPPRVFGVQKITDAKTGKSKWRMIWGSRDGDSENEKKDWDEIENKGLLGDTIYSLNWIPLGGFVKIKGEDGSRKNDKDSFSNKGAWPRIKVLAAGVMMNFLLAWVLLSFVFMIGAPEVTESSSGAVDKKIQIAEVLPETPAAAMGLRIGDEVVRSQTAPSGETVNLKNVPDLQNYIASHKGQEITFEIKRGGESLELKGTPRTESPEGQGALGVALVETSVVSYPWYLAIWKGLEATFNLIVAIITAFFGILGSLIMGKGAGADLSGPIGIAVLTKEVTGLGLTYVLQFAALLSVNLGIINALPIPALDGGRILFVIIEKIKGSPVNQKIEQIFHTVGFVLLIMLMILVTFKDVSKFVN